MPTPAALVTELCEDAGISDASGSDDRVKAMKCLNRAASEITSHFRTIKGSGTLTAGSTSYTLASSVTRAVGLDALLVAGRSTPLPRSSYIRVRALQNAGNTGDPTVYAFEDGTVYTDSAGSSALTALCYLSWSDVNESSAESAISGIPVDWHRRLLLPLATAILLEGWEGEEERAAVKRRVAAEAWAQFGFEQARKGGLDLAQYAIADFSTPTPLSGR